MFGGARTRVRVHPAPDPFTPCGLIYRKYERNVIVMKELQPHHVVLVFRVMSSDKVVIRALRTLLSANKDLPMMHSFTLVHAIHSAD